MIVLSLVVTLLAFTPALGFVVVYSRSKWRANPVGQSAMLLAVSIMVILGVSIVLQLWPGHPELRWLRILVFVFVIVALWRQLFVLIGIQRRKPKYMRYFRSEDNEPVA